MPPFHTLFLLSLRFCVPTSLFSISLCFFCILNCPPATGNYYKRAWLCFYKYLFVFLFSCVLHFCICLFFAFNCYSSTLDTQTWFDERSFPRYCIRFCLTLRAEWMLECSGADLALSGFVVSNIVCWTDLCRAADAKALFFLVFLFFAPCARLFLKSVYVSARASFLVP